MAKKPDELAFDDPAAVAAEAVRAYNPETDFRVWRKVAEAWRSQAAELCEICEGLSADGRPAAEISRRLKSEFASRSLQDFFGEASNEFAKLASEFVLNERSNEKTAQLHRAIEEKQRARAAAAAENAEREQRNREARAAELEREAERLRTGPSGISSFLAR